MKYCLFLLAIFCIRWRCARWNSLQSDFRDCNPPSWKYVKWVAPPFHRKFGRNRKGAHLILAVPSSQIVRIPGNIVTLSDLACMSSWNYPARTRLGCHHNVDPMETTGWSLWPLNELRETVNQTQNLSESSRMTNCPASFNFSNYQNSHFRQYN